MEFARERREPLSLEMRMSIVVRFGDYVLAAAYEQAIRQIDPSLTIHRRGDDEGVSLLQNYDLLLINARASTLYQVEELVEGIATILSVVSRPA